MTSFSDALLGWYDNHRRDLPWRSDRPNPYHVWLSEIMLQQTTVKTVIPYFLKFIEAWPTLNDLAAASLDDVLILWQGLGYYSRARNLHKCAQYVQNHYDGQFPEEEVELLTLPGIGPYTAAAISSIAFERPAAAVDGNVIRVLSRLHALPDPRPQLDKFVRETLISDLPQTRCGDFTQALMELGAIVCRPKSPDCGSCPLQRTCQGHSSPQLYPTPKEKKALPTRYAIAYLVHNEEGAILLRKRDDAGMLGGMMEVPTTPWDEQNPGSNMAHHHAPVADLEWVELPGIVKHTFSHFHFHITVHKALSDVKHEGAGTWVPHEKLGDCALPTVMKKIISHGVG